jgi:hypothetical protein
MIPTPIIGRDKLVEDLRDAETRLGTAEMEALMAEQDPETRQKFVKYRDQVTILKGKLENAQLADILASLTRLGPELKTGVEKMQKELGVINNAIAIVNTVGTVLGLVGRVLGLAR